MPIDPAPDPSYAVAFVWYDYLLTFGDEMELFWKKKRAFMTSFICISLRYPLLANVLFLLAFTDKLPRVRIRT